MTYYNSGGYLSQSNPAYAGTQEKYRPADTVVPIVNTQAPQMAPKWSWCATGWSIFSCMCCMSSCGFFGLLYSIWSYIDHKSGDYERANFKRRWSWGCAIFGILFTVLVIVALIVFFIIFREDVCDSLDDPNAWDFCAWDLEI